MIKGAVVVKTAKTRKYADIYRAWYNSDHDTLVIHCPDAKVLQHARNAALRFRERNELTGRVSISRYEGDLYLMRIGDQKYAMEAFPQEDGWIFYYDTEKEKEI